jgi:hypothetical protein
MNASNFTAMLRSAPALLFLFPLVCPGVFAEGPILIPRVAKGGVVSYKVDRAGDQAAKDRDEPTKPTKMQTFQGTVVGDPDEFGHIRVSQKRGKDLFVTLLPDCRAVKDELIKLEAIEEGKRVLIVGQKRGLVGGLPKDAAPRRILGAQLIFRLAEPKEPASDAPATRKEPADALRGEVVSKEPLLVKDAAGELYDVRPVTNYRVLQVLAAGQEDLKKGALVLLTGYEERETLRPKGKTVERSVFYTRSFRILSPALTAKEYEKVLQYDASP